MSKRLLVRLYNETKAKLDELGFQIHQMDDEDEHQDVNNSSVIDINEQLMTRADQEEYKKFMEHLEGESPNE